MGALAANRIIKAQNPGNLNGHGVGASIHIYQGSLCFIEASDGYLTTDDNGGANQFAGVAKNEADNSAGADNALKAEVYRSGRFWLPGTGLAVTDIGKKVYAINDGDVQLSSTNASLVGSISHFESSTEVAVDIDVQPA